MAAFKERILGATGLTVGPLGLAASYGAPAEAFEEAFESGCNYFYLGTGLCCPIRQSMHVCAVPET
jgi:hypothetical protein